MVSQDDVRQKLLRVLARAAHLPVTELTGRETLDMLGVDSAGAVSLTAYIEEEFGVFVEPEAVVGDVTLDQMAGTVYRKMKVDYATPE